MQWYLVCISSSLLRCSLVMALEQCYLGKLSPWMSSLAPGSHENTRLNSLARLALTGRTLCTQHYIMIVTCITAGYTLE